MATINGTSGNDSLFVPAGSSNNTLLGLAGNDSLDALTGAGNNLLSGGDGDDELFAYINEQLFGDAGNDSLYSDGNGDNTLSGGDGNDDIFGDRNDIISGDAGDDQIFGGSGGNTLTGGLGKDIFWLANVDVPETANRITDFDPVNDRLIVKLAGVNSFSDFAIAANGNDTTINLKSSGQPLVLLKNTAPHQFNPFNLVTDSTIVNQGSQLRVATFNASLNRNNEGQLINDLSTPNHPQAKNIAEIIQRTNPDIILLNEFDYDDNGTAIDLFRQNYLEVSQNGANTVEYPYVYLAPSNTGIPSGFDLDNNGTSGGGNDAFGFGNFAGQFAMVLLSKYPILTEEVRTFQNFLWKDMPGNLLTNDPSVDNPATPVKENLNGFYSPEEIEVLRLSSKSHWDVPVSVNGEVIHLLAAHPTPPVFDGSEDRNGKRNFDEIRFWKDYVTSGKHDYIYDDKGNTSGLAAGDRFVIVGDYNADPFDGDAYSGAANQFFNTPAIQGSTTDAAITPSSTGGPDASTRQGALNLTNLGNPAFDTADFGPDTIVGNLRVDYVLPSYNTTITDAGVFWHPQGTEFFDLVGEFNPALDPNVYPSRTVSSDHRLVYVDLTLNPTATLAQEQDRKTITEVESLGMVSFPTSTTFNNTQLGGLSGITYDANRGLYYSISDDRSNINPARFYTLTIDLSDGSLDNGDVNFTNVTTLLDANGNPFAANSLDSEGIALTEDGSVYISSEGEANPVANRLTSPFVNQFSLSGLQLSSLPVDSKFIPTSPFQDLNGDGAITNADQPFTPTTGIRNNLAFESLTITPNGRYLYTATENALAQDGTVATLDDTSFSRILKYDLTTGEVVAEFVYEVEKVADAPNPVGSFATNGLVELLAIDNNGTLLALERSFSNGVGNNVKLYEVLTQGALNVKDFNDLFREEPLEDDGEIIAPNRFAIDSPVQKRLLVDFKADLGITPDNLEGLALGPQLADGRQSLIVISDNNFSATQTTQFIALALDVETIPAALPTVETPYTIDDEDGTTPVIGDSDDPSVWVNPNNSGESIVISTLKDGGLAVFNLDGSLRQTITAVDILGTEAEYGDIRYNNVDVLYGFRLGTEIVDIAVASDRENDTLAIFKIDASSRQLINITSTSLLASNFSIFGVDDGEATAYGLGGYKSPITGKHYVFVTQADGNKIAQLELKSDDATITAEVVRTLTLPLEAGEDPNNFDAADYQSEAIVVDQELGIVYVGVENKLGIVKFAAEPYQGDNITIVRPTDSPELVPDLEGLGIYYGPDGTGYLIASSQGNSSYAVYSREGTNQYLGSFVVGDNQALGIDQANETDGLEIINVPLGAKFPFGALLVQDGANDPQNAVENDEEVENNSTNFKFVPWENVANAFETPLIVDTQGFDPRLPIVPLSPFPNGVASGDTSQTSTVLWTRATNLGTVTFEYSTQADFSTIAGTVTTTVTNALQPVKVDITNLMPGTNYFYRVTDATGETATGKFSTAAAVGTQAGLRFGVSGDWRGELSPYPAIANADERNLKFFIALGDTIYADYPSPALKNPDGSEKEQAITLDDFRIKHGEVYGSRFDLNTWGDLRASTSILATIDDHEVVNDFQGGENLAGKSAAEQALFGATTGLVNDSPLYEAGLQAFQEYNPIRDQSYGQTGDPRTDGERKLYRVNTFGSDAVNFVLDARSFRDAGLPGVTNLNDPVQVGNFLAQSFNPNRTFLGRVQVEDLKRDLLQAHKDGITWKFINLPEPVQNIGVVGASDRYEGYAAERTEILKFINDNGINNVVFIAADIHGTLVNNLTYQLAPNQAQIATNAFEISTGAVAFDAPFGPTVAQLAGALGILTPEQLALYNSLPVANDADSTINDKDDFIKSIVNSGLQPLGYDPLGLNNNLPQANGLINATLLQGDYIATQTYGWTEFNIDQETQKLTVTTYGIAPYTREELEANPNAVTSRQPSIVSQFEVTPNPVAAEPKLVPSVGTPGDDDLVAINGTAFDGKSNIVFTGAGEDTIELTTVATTFASGNNRINTGSDDDTVFLNKNERIFGSAGDDTFDATDGKGGNRISGGAGDDLFFLGAGDRALGGDGDDQFYVQSGGDNLLSGGAGKDLFWIVNAEVPEDSNTIVDFQIGTDMMGILGSAGLGITSATLSLTQVGADTAVVFAGQTLAVLSGIQSTSLTLTDPHQFAFA